MKVECLCIDDKNRPKEILPQNWIMRGIEYHIIHVYYYPNQGIQGVLLEEVNTKSTVYDSYRLTRFSFTEESLKQLKELIFLCTQLNEMDINKLLEECNLETIKEDGNTNTEKL